MKKLIFTFMMFISSLASAEFVTTEDGQSKGYVRFEADITGFKATLEKNNVAMVHSIGLNLEVMSSLNELVVAGMNLQVKPQLDFSANEFRLQQDFEFSLMGGLALYNKNGLLVGVLLETGIYDPREDVELDHLIGSQVVFVSKNQVTTLAVGAHTPFGESYLKDIGLDIKGRSSILLENGILDYLVLEAGIYNLGSSKLDLSVEVKAMLEFLDGNVAQKKTDAVNTHFYLAPSVNFQPNTKQIKPTLEFGVRAKL